MRYDNEIKGKAKQVKGTAKTELGKLTNDRALETSSLADLAECEVQAKFGKATRKIGESIEDFGGKSHSSR